MNNVAELEVTSHRHAVASAALVVQCGPTPPSSTLLPDKLSQPDPGNMPLPSQAPSDSADGTSHKRQCLTSETTTLSLSLDNDDSNSYENTIVSKKARMNPPLCPNNISLHSDVQIVDINNVDDPHDEPLNKLDPTADIKAFFTSLPHVSGHSKQHVSCNMCA